MALSKRGDTSYDFWLGKWVTSWQDGAGHRHKGSNVVLKLDGSVREMFEGPSSPRRYVGVSLSTWKPHDSVWEQEYWDNTGYHAFFRGGWADDRFILDQMAGALNEPKRRLVWHSVEVDTMLWDYESSSDGRAWTSTWHIAYKRTE